jgi:hypothetical protein
MSDETTPTPEVDTVASETEPKRRGRPPKSEESTELVSALNQLAGLVKQQSEQVSTLAKDVERLKNPSLPPPPEDLAPQPLPEGVTRFQSKYRNYSISYEDTNEAIVGGQVVVQPAAVRKTTKKGDPKVLHFNDFVADVTDPALVEYLKQHPDYGVDFVINNLSTPVNPTKVEAGPRGQKDEPTPRSPLQATY